MGIWAMWIEADGTHTADASHILVTQLHAGFHAMPLAVGNGFKSFRESHFQA